MKSNYLCSGLVYCSCGAKMHGSSPKRKGHEYTYFSCAKRCGMSLVRMEDVDTAAKEYLNALLSPSNQKIITAKLRTYQSDDTNRTEAFTAALNKNVRDKQKQYDNLMQNLSSGSMPPEIMEDVGNRMKEIKEEIETLKAVAPPEDFTVEYIKSWLESLKSAPDDKAIHLLIESERIDLKDKTDFNITSTLKSVLGENGANHYKGQGKIPYSCGFQP